MPTPTNPVRFALRLADVAVHVAADHPLRAMKAIADEACAGLSDGIFDDGRLAGPWPAPVARLLKASLLMWAFGMTNARIFWEEAAYNVGVRWFLDLADDELPPTEAAVKVGHERLDASHVAQVLLASVVMASTRAGLPTAGYFVVASGRAPRDGLPN